MQRKWDFRRYGKAFCSSSGEEFISRLSGE
jgi:hypothetical protein